MILEMYRWFENFAASVFLASETFLWCLVAAVHTMVRVRMCLLDFWLIFWFAGVLFQVLVHEFAAVEFFAAHGADEAFVDCESFAMFWFVVSDFAAFDVAICEDIETKSVNSTCFDGFFVVQRVQFLVVIA